MLPRRDLGRLALWLGLSFAAAAVGSVFTAGALADWYPALAKPTWTPPSWLFGPVWTALYALMGVAAFRVSRVEPQEARRLPLMLFTGQLALNAAWSGLFFGLRNPTLGLVGIVVLWGAIVATLLSFHRVDRTAAVMLVPYLAWTTFAAALNAAIWAMNP